MFANARLRIAAAIAMASAVAGLGVRSVGPMPLPQSPRKRTPAPRVKVRRTGWGAKPPVNGAQECARRRAQIAKGMLTESNGLVMPGKRYLGHGVSIDV